MKAIKLFLKAFLTILAMMFALIVAVAALFFSVNGREQADQERLYPAAVGEKRALVLDQNSRFGATGRAVLILLTGFDAQQTAELNEVKQAVHGADLLYSIKVDRD